MNELFQSVVMRLALSGLAASFVVLALHSRMARDTFARLLTVWRSLTAFGRVAVCSFLLIGVLVGGDKTNGVFKTGLTSLTGFEGVFPRVPLSQNPVNPVNPVQTTGEDVARGWRVESVATNAAVSYAMPANGTLVGNWHVHGAGSSFGNNRIDFGDWRFPIGTNAVVDASQDRIYTCPISANYHPPVKATLGDVEYAPLIAIVEPNEVVTKGVEWGENGVDLFYEGSRKCWPSGSVGTATLVTTNYIGPMTVSFRGIAVSEVPCYEEDAITGCLTNVRWRTHTIEAGAGRAHPIGQGNFWFVDSALLSPSIANWEPGGELVLKIPVGWHRRGASDEVFWVLDSDYECWRDTESRPLLFNSIYRQRFAVDNTGTCRTEKYGHWISRSRFCRVILDGEVLQRRHPLW